MIIFADARKKLAQMAGNPDEANEVGEEQDPAAYLNELAKDAIQAMKNGDAVAYAKAMKAFFFECDEMPHEEGGEQE